MVSVRTILAILCCLLIGMIPEVANAKFLVHATRRAFVPKIMKNDFSKYKMKPTARIGRKEYFGGNVKTAIKEKPRADVAILFRKSRTFNKRILDTTRMSNNKLRVISGIKDMRGKVKNGVLGPKIGHRIGNYANRNKLIVKYNSARYSRGINYAIPSKLYREHPRIVRPVKSLNLR